MTTSKGPRHHLVATLDTRNVPTAASVRLSLAIQFEDTVAIDDQLALLAARQVEVVHQGAAGIVIVPVALVVHARALIAATALSVLARIIPSSVRYRPSLRVSRCLGCP